MFIVAIILGAMTMTTMSKDLECAVVTDFTDPESNRRWTSVNDNVMGGRSDGRFEIANERLTFTGDINTNGGGFSSIRWAVPEGMLSDAHAVRVRLKTDGRAYDFNIRTEYRIAGRQLTYRGDLDRGGAAEWHEVIVQFDDMLPTIFGQIIKSAPPFDPDDVQSLGFILADGRDGPFRAEIERIDVCRIT